MYATDIFLFTFFLHQIFHGVMEPTSRPPSWSNEIPWLRKKWPFHKNSQRCPKLFSKVIFFARTFSCYDSFPRSKKCECPHHRQKKRGLQGPDLVEKHVKVIDCSPPDSKVIHILAEGQGGALIAHLRIQFNVYFIFFFSRKKNVSRNKKAVDRKES